ncbi:hypothetical protein CYMTET_48246 [Cymbomonas tetramitiformis]|uniref:Uncharacterized protein n=1 Tax=Cymbomonas tetramitiformis TaxID=36881 RepID=A0AAE0BSS2_9CHLO|nr:hypothetical protein CYMTET_48246 [Cymbomonas tetramitiformis]
MRAELLKPGSTFAKQLAQNPTVLQVGDTLFAHAGILPEHGLAEPRHSPSSLVYTWHLQAAPLVYTWHLQAAPLVYTWYLQAAPLVYMCTEVGMGVRAPHRGAGMGVRLHSRAGMEGPVLLRVGMEAGPALRVGMGVATGLDKINERVSGWMDGTYKHPPKEVIDSEGVVWNRSYGGESAELYGANGACSRLDIVLKETQAKRMVIGHTPQAIGANAECSSKLWRIDVGASRGIMGAPPQVIEIMGDKVKVMRR